MAKPSLKSGERRSRKCLHPAGKEGPRSGRDVSSSDLVEPDWACTFKASARATHPRYPQPTRSKCVKKRQNAKEVYEAEQGRAGQGRRQGGAGAQSRAGQGRPHHLQKYFLAENARHHGLHAGMLGVSTVCACERASSRSQRRQ